MNQISEVVTTLIHYNVVVRDTLEYTLKKDKYDENLFKEKQRSVLIEVNQPTPLKSIIDHSGENGVNLEKSIREFHEKVYGEKSSILKLAEDGLRVDHAQHLAIFQGVVPIHSNVEAMILGIIADAHKNNADVADAEKANDAENRLYCGVAYMTIVSELVKLFGDYNQARREAKGEETPSSKFIGNDIGTVIGLLNTVRANSRLTDGAYKNIEDKVFGMVEMMTGRRDLPQGKNFGDIIKDTQESIGAYVREVEPLFRDVYVPLINALVEQASKDNNQIKGSAATPEAVKTEPTQIEGEAVELDPRTGLPKA